MEVTLLHHSFQVSEYPDFHYLRLICAFQDGGHTSYLPLASFAISMSETPLPCQRARNVVYYGHAHGQPLS
jgi:hypothetical protein